MYQEMYFLKEYTNKR